MKFRLAIKTSSQYQAYIESSWPGDTKVDKIRWEVDARYSWSAC